MGVVASVTSTFSFVLVSGGHVGAELCSERLAQILKKYTGMVFGWLIPCLFVLPVAASMAELASAMP